MTHFLGWRFNWNHQTQIQEMHSYTGDEASLRHESFGWWMSDLIDIIKVTRIPKPDVSISSTCRRQPQLDSEESKVSSHKVNKTDENQRTVDFEDNTPVYKNNVSDANISHQIEYNAPVSPVTAERTRTRGPSSEITVKEESTSENSACSKQQLVATINPRSPGHEQEEAVLNQGYQNEATLTKLRRQVKISRASNTSIKCLSDLITTLQNEWTSQVDDDHRGLSPFVKLALSIEHDPDRKLDESRCEILQGFRELDSRLRALQEDARELQLVTNSLQQDFQFQERVVEHVTAEIRHLAEDIQDTQYLDDLIFLLQGQLDRITLQKWPFIVARVLPRADSSRELNLVI